jgi:hypothetical protein
MDQVDDDGAPLYYRHRLPSPEIESVTITDLAGNKVTEGWVLREGDILHSFKGDAYWVSYYENRMPQRRMIMYTPTFVEGSRPELRFTRSRPAACLRSRARVQPTGSGSRSPTNIWSWRLIQRRPTTPGM